MMKTRTRKPAAGTDSARASQIDTSSAKYMATMSARYGTTEVSRSIVLRRTLACAYGARSFFHQARRVVPVVGAGVPPSAASVTSSPNVALCRPTDGHLTGDGRRDRSREWRGAPGGGGAPTGAGAGLRPAGARVRGPPAEGFFDAADRAGRR